jgi:hypothetical protein
MWLYNDKEINNIEDFGENMPFGFVYIITNLKTKQFYIGKKFLVHSRKRKFGKKEIALQTGVGRKKTSEVVKQESDWKTYWSSSKPLQEQVKQLGETEFTREIIALGKNSKHLNYLETKYQFTYEVLENELSLCDNISGRFFKKDLV